MTYSPRTETEINEIALGYVENRIWGSWSDNGNGLQAFRTILMLLGEEEKELMKKTRIVSFYELIEKAGPFAVNGRPVFFSCNSLDVDDTNRVLRKIQELHTAMAAVLKNEAS